MRWIVRSGRIITVRLVDKQGVCGKGELKVVSEGQTLCKRKWRSHDELASDIDTRHARC